MTRRLQRIGVIMGVFGAMMVVPAFSAQPRDSINPDNLRQAINDMIKTFGVRYPQGRQLLKQLKGAEQQGEQAALDALAKAAMIANPLVGDQPLVFIVRKQYKKDHHNTATLFQTNEINTNSYEPGGPMKAIDLRTGTVRTLVDPGPNGRVRDPELSFDGMRIVFSMRKHIDDNYHLYEVGVDGSGFRQLTFAPDVADFDPAYLADGSIVFSSSREPKYCMCNRHIMANLFRMDGDGANIFQIGKSTLFEGHSTLMADGRILYDRWEYIDRNFGDAQGLWTVNPDGTNHAIFWGNNTSSPGGVIDARMIPGTELCLCIFGSCHDRPWGALTIVDRNKGVDGREPVVRTWPAHAVNLVSTEGTSKWDAFMKVRPLYEDPYPLSKNYFLVSRTLGKGEETGIFVVDTFGNEVLLHAEGLGCFDPMPIVSRTPPPVIPMRRNFASKTGHFYVQNVYLGTHMQGVKPGEIKYLRIIESPEKRNWVQPSWNGQGQHAPGLNWHSFENKRILGTVPVEEDGSAFFELPAETYVFFQVLDKDKMLVQSMRSGTIVQPGETQGCVGCHEDRVKETPVQAKLSKAFTKPPHKMTGWYGAPRIFNYLSEVQPVFDKHCVTCHDYGKPGAKKLILARDKNISFNASYIDLWSRGAINCVGGGPAAFQAPRSWGSHASKLIKVLRKGHHDITLSSEEMDRLVTWLDLNAPYYAFYESAYPNNPCGRSPITERELKRLAALTKATFHKGHNKKHRAQISFDRPQMSLCLTKLDTESPEYAEALAIIAKGKQRLAQVPRADMPGFIPCETDRKRNEKYAQRLSIEHANRTAIQTGKKYYEKEGL